MTSAALGKAGFARCCIPGQTCIINTVQCRDIVGGWWSGFDRSSIFFRRGGLRWFVGIRTTARTGGHQNRHSGRCKYCFHPGHIIPSPVLPIAPSISGSLTADRYQIKVSFGGWLGILTQGTFRAFDAGSPVCFCERPENVSHDVHRGAILSRLRFPAQTFGTKVKSDIAQGLLFPTWLTGFGSTEVHFFLRFHSIYFLAFSPQ